MKEKTTIRSTGKVRCAKCGGWKTPHTSTRPRNKVSRTSATERPDPPPSMTDAIRALRRGSTDDDRLTKALRARMPKPPTGEDPPRVARSTVLPPDCVPSPTSEQFRAAIIAARGGAK